MLQRLASIAAILLIVSMWLLLRRGPAEATAEQLDDAPVPVEELEEFVPPRLQIIEPAEVDDEQII
jgi:hypothetical protein